MALRLDPFLDERAEGKLGLIGGGGEATVFFDGANQQVIKLFAPPCKAAFGWIAEAGPGGQWQLRPGALDEALERFALFESLFSSGLEVETVGQSGDFLTLSQPFIAGGHPEASQLDSWMQAHGWTRWQPPATLDMLRHLTWRRGPHLATDVRPENALVSASDGVLRPIDFVVALVK